MDLTRIAILALLFAGVTASVLAVYTVAMRRSRLRGRMGRVLGQDSGFTGTVDAETLTPLQRIAAPVAKIATPDTEEEVTRFRARFYNAGIRSRSAPLYFFAAKAILAIALPVVLWIGIQVNGPNISGRTELTLLVGLAALGYYLPNIVLRRLAEARQRQLFEAFPDALDLMVVCVEAGLSLDLAMQRAGREMRIRSAALADELALVETELRIGSTRERALRNLAARTGVEEIRLFVSMLLQADRFGTSIADSIRIHADELRVRRQNRAEEIAMRLPTMLLFPLVLTIFPALFVVLLGPPAIGLMRQVFPAIAGSN